MIPDMLDAISLLESLRKYFIKNVRRALKDCPESHSQGSDTQVEGAGDRMLDPDDVEALRKSLAKNKYQRKTYRGIIDRCVCMHLVYMRTKSFPHFFAHYESYFPDFLDSPFPSASGPFFREALHLKDTSAEEMEDYRKTELACRKFMHDAILFTKSVAYTDMSGETRVDEESYDHPEFLVIVDELLRGDVLYDTDMVASMIETWLQSLDGLVWRLERIFEVELH